MKDPKTEVSGKNRFENHKLWDIKIPAMKKTATDILTSCNLSSMDTDLQFNKNCSFLNSRYNGADYKKN